MVIPGKRTVLIVDDEAVIRENLERLLRSSAYEPKVASGGQEALTLASQQEFEVVLLDVRMPGLTGLDVLRQLHASYPYTGVIMVTASSDVQTAVESMRLGAYDYIIKPFNAEDILIRVEKAREKRYLSLQVRDYQENLEKKVAEQAKQLREFMTKAVEATIQQELLSRELEARGGKQKAPSSGMNVKEFGASVLHRFNSFSSKPT